MSSLPLPGRQRTEVWGDDSKMNEVLKVRQRLGSTGESKGHHGSFQPASLPRTLVTAINFSLRKPTPTVSA